MKKKLLSIMLSVCVLGCSVVGCSEKNDEKQKTTNSSKEKTEQGGDVASIDINIGCMKGPTAIGMIKLLSDSDEGKSSNHYNYKIAGAADELSTSLVKGELDVAAVPCNLASVLYNKTKGEVVTVAINTLGVLYIVEGGESVESVIDLMGKTIYSTGQGTTPEYTLRYLLESVGVNPDEDVDIRYKSEATEVVATLAENPDAVAMLPQPYTTVALSQNDSLRIALDVTEEWEKNADSTVVTGVLVARKSFIEENKEGFTQFLKEYNQSTQYANSNVEETANLLEKFDVFKSAIAKQAIPYCNVTYIDGQEMKEKVLAYLQVLYDKNPDAVGGKVEEGMFYIAGE